ncbi:MAG: hypothetical protein ACIALR_06235 [Blastopirellula sp. JB062]
MNERFSISLHPCDKSGRFPVSFEQLETEWSAWPRMFFEPDGSFVWVAEDQSWQIDGVVYDRDDQVFRVDLAGVFQAEPFQQLARSLGWPVTTLRVELVQDGKFIDVESFLRDVFS